MVTIGGVTFDHDPIRKINRQDISAVRELAIDGTEIVTETPRASGYPIDLIMTRETGWITTSTRDALYALFAVPGATYTLNYRGEVCTVRPRHEDKAIEVETFFPQADPTAARTLWTGTIRLMTVEA